MNWDPWERGTCGDCGVREGEFHSPGCDMEICPFCLQQLITCGCCYEHLGLDCSPGTWTWHNGLNKEQNARWSRILEAEGLIRFAREPNMCARCGEVWPEMFQADDWDEVIPHPLKREMLCRRCYEAIRSFMHAAMGRGD